MSYVGNKSHKLTLKEACLVFWMMLNSRSSNKNEFFVHLSWSIDIWAKINDVMLSQTVSSCVTGSPPSPQITKEQLGRNRQ